MLEAPLVGAVMRIEPSLWRATTWVRLANACAPVTSKATGLEADFGTGVVMMRLSMFTAMRFLLENSGSCKVCERGRWGRSSIEEVCH
ncbi:hypothetical protein D3C73_1198830 [compost metagenome]